MTESMIERATLAVVEIWQKSNAPVGTALDCAAVATAVLRSIREPTDEMLVAGLIAGSKCNKHFADKLDDPKALAASLVSTGDGRLYKEAYNAMIDAALQWPTGSADRAGVPLAKD